MSEPMLRPRLIIGRTARPDVVEVKRFLQRILFVIKRSVHELIEVRFPAGSGVGLTVSVLWQTQRNIINTVRLSGYRGIAPGVSIAHSHRRVGDRGRSMFRTIAVDKHCHRSA